MNREWLRARDRAMNRLREHAVKDLVDEDIKDFLLDFNSRNECVFTTSSCSGRIAIIQGKNIFDKKGSRIVAQTHDPENCRDLEIPLEKRDSGIMWLSLQPPILHIVADSLVTAENIVKIAENTGFNRACYKKYRLGGFHVEVAFSDKLTIINPRKDDLLFACEVLYRYKKRLYEFIDKILNKDLCGRAQSAATASSPLSRGLDDHHRP